MVTSTGAGISTEAGVPDGADGPMSENTTAGTGAGAMNLSDEDAVKQVLVESVLGLWEVVNKLPDEGIVLLRESQSAWAQMPAGAPSHG